MSKLLPEGTYVGYPVGGAPPGPLKPPQGPQGVTEFWKKLQKFPKKLWKLYMHQNTPNNNSKTHFGLLGLPGGALGGQKVILLGPRFFLVKSMWSFRQNILYLSQVSGLGGHGTWFWLCTLPAPLSWTNPKISGKIQKNVRKKSSDLEKMKCLVESDRGSHPGKQPSKPSTRTKVFLWNGRLNGREFMNT